MDSQDLEQTDNSANKSYQNALCWYNSYEFNRSISADLFEKARTLGSDKACFHLGVMYTQGIGVDPDSYKAISLFEEGAKKDNPDCLYALGLMYKTGWLKGKNEKIASDLFGKAAQKGHEKAIREKRNLLYTQVNKDEKKYTGYTSIQNKKEDPGYRFISNEKKNLGYTFIKNKKEDPGYYMISDEENAFSGYIVEKKPSQSSYSFQKKNSKY